MGTHIHALGIVWCCLGSFKCEVGKLIRGLVVEGRGRHEIRQRLMIAFVWVQGSSDAPRNAAVKCAADEGMPFS